jgi:hypothetical protein
MASTPRYDLALHWVLYSHMFLNAPMFRFLWIRELHRMGVRISAAFLESLVTASWVVLVCYLAFYLAHLVRTIRSGASVNPIKYAFIGSSYFLWYYRRGDGTGAGEVPELAASCPIPASIR